MGLGVLAKKKKKENLKITDQPEAGGQDGDLVSEVATQHNIK